MWLQSYSPVLDSVMISAVVALLPVALVFILIGGFRSSTTYGHG